MVQADLSSKLTLNNTLLSSSPVLVQLTFPPACGGVAVASVLGLRLPRGPVRPRCYSLQQRSISFGSDIVFGYSFSSPSIDYTRTCFDFFSSPSLSLLPFSYTRARACLTSPLLPRPSAVTCRNGSISCTARYRSRVRCAGLALAASPAGVVGAPGSSPCSLCPRAMRYALSVVRDDLPIRAPSLD